MTRQQRTAAILLAAFLVLAAVVYWVEFRPDEEPEEPLYEPLWDLSAPQIVQITVDPADGAAFRVERDEVGSWHVVLPFPGEADQSYMEGLADYLAEMETYRRFTPDEVDLEEFGLITPTATVTLRLREGDEHVLQVGAQDPRRIAFYVRWGEEVNLCPRGTIERILGAVTYPPVPSTPFPEAPPLQTSATAAPTPVASPTP